MMWYGVLGTKELLHRTYKNLEQRVLLEVRHPEAECTHGIFLSAGCFTNVTSVEIRSQCDGRPIPLPSLQGIAVLNIPSYGGGTNFWGGTKEDEVNTKHVHDSCFILLCQSNCLPVCLSVPLPVRPSQRRPLTIRSWRWWLCLAAYRWLCRESSTCSTTALHRCSRLSAKPSLRHSAVCPNRRVTQLCPSASVSHGEDHHPG